MPTFDIVKKSEPNQTFRVASVMGKFDLQSNKIEERFTGSIDMPDEWQIGMIIGKSGSGKTTIARQLFPESYFQSFEWGKNSILDDMPEGSSVEQITRMFNSVGFSSPPSWLKTYDVLSNGEKMRVDLARALLSDTELLVFDEFTSVVDRQIAQIGSFAVQKAIRKTKKQFIAVSCHYDIEDWLLPDWVFDTNNMTFRLCEGQKKNRPEIKCQIYETKEKTFWSYFARFHYLNHTHNNSARMFLMIVNDELAGLCSIIQNAGHSGMKLGHRVVILPDYQGVGIGSVLVNKVAETLSSEGLIFSFKTSNPSLIHAFKKDPKWKCISYGRAIGQRGWDSIRRSDSRSRITCSMRYIGDNQGVKNIL
jgi:ABC-type ATPase with predicted acetyltransferase domain